MNILQVSSYFFVDWAKDKPVETIYGLSKALVKRGHKVAIYTTDAFNKEQKAVSPFKTLNVDGIEVLEFRSLASQLGKKTRIYYSPSMTPMLAKQVPKFDIIHLHEYRTFQNIIAHRYAKKYRIPYVLQAHGSLPTSFQRGGLKRAFDAVWGHRILNDASKVIAVTKMEAQQYHTMGVDENKIEIVPNGIDLSEFENLPERGEFARQHNLDGQRIVLFLGRINKIKGLGLLAKAFAELTKNLENVKLVIVGPDDGYLSTLKKVVADLGISDKVLFPGPLYGREKLKAYVDADVYVLPSVYEIFGITVLEACACGTPVIVTDRCGLADIINNQAGLVVPYDSEQLRIALLRVLSDNKAKLQFGEKGKQLVREKFNWEKIAERVEGLYTGVQNG